MTQLTRTLGPFDSIMMMVGIVVGSGIFLTTGIMAESLPSAPLLLLAWAVGGLLTLAGALTFAELGAALPEAGGQYVYMKEAYGPLWAFLFGWILFLVAMGGSIAALAVGFAEYVGYFVPWVSSGNALVSVPLPVLGALQISSVQVVALLVVLVLSAFTYLGTGYGKGIQNVSTVLKIGTLLAFAAVGLVMGRGIDGGFDPVLNPTSLSGPELAVGFGVALIAVSWSFDGWHNINYVAGEIRDPGRNLPRTLIAGTLLITVLYLLVNVVYLMALPMAEVAGTVRIAEAAATALWGGTGATLVSGAVVVSTFGALNGAIFAGPRVYYAMALDGAFFRRAAEVHPRFGTPGWSIVAQAGWAGLLTLSGSYEQLFTYVVFVTLLYWIAAVSTVFVLRKKRPDLERPYRTWGYPVVPGLFIVGTTVIAVNTLVARPVQSLGGLAIALLGIPVYLVWKRKAVRQP